MLAPIQDDVKDIIKELDCVVRLGYDPRSVFDDWAGLMLNALMRNEDAYLSIVRRYRNSAPHGHREIDFFCAAFGKLMSKMSETNRELLGHIYESWASSNKYVGQFFTPDPVAAMMAAMLVPKSGNIADPCCGAGIMLISACKQMSNAELDKAVFVGQDIDLTCVMMCALNFTFFNLNGFVIWGNSLTNERRRVFRTIRSYMGGSVIEVDVSSLPVPEMKPFEGKEVSNSEIEVPETKASRKASNQIALF